MDADVADAVAVDADAADAGDSSAGGGVGTGSDVGGVGGRALGAVTLGGGESDWLDCFGLRLMVRRMLW